jgi:peptide/nickel transport system substrate-binding protein
MANWGYGWIFTPTSYPSGEELFETGATTNAGSYSDPVNDQNTNRSLTEGLSALYTYENYLVKQLPVIWLPLPVYQISEVAHDLRGISPQDPFDQIYPENWYFSKS